MADICMCSDDKCPYAKTCYRHEAHRDEYWQTYFTNSPRKADGSCRFRWDIDSISAIQDADSADYMALARNLTKELNEKFGNNKSKYDVSYKEDKDEFRY